MYIDSHTHLYLDAFAEDRPDMVQRAIEAGVSRMYLPNIDHSSIGPMFDLVKKFPGNCFPMMGLHPTSVKENYLEELAIVEKHLDEPGICAIGECGIDLYWDKSFLQEQIEVFTTQINWARERQLPLVIHARDSFPEIFETLDRADTDGLSGVFHSFSGGSKELEKALSYGFMIGINGIVTFKNSSLGAVAREIPLDRLLLETDAPFLTPHPHRGKRNESSYIPLIAQRMGEIHNLSEGDIGELSSRNALHLFSRNHGGR